LADLCDDATVTEIRYEVDDPVALITLNRPDKPNALTYPMLTAFRHAVDEAANDPRVVGIIVTGAGRGLCSGLDASVPGATATAGSSSRPDR
jgi:enoyl-CoA hydratase/carnithine racemase